MSWPWRDCPHPGCTQPAEVTEFVELESTDGPVMHVRLLCVMGHGFFGPNDML